MRKFNTLHEAAEKNPEGRIGILLPKTKLPESSCVLHIAENGPTDYIYEWSHYAGRLIAEDKLDDALIFLESHHKHWTDVLGNPRINNTTAVAILAILGVSIQLIGIVRVLLDAGPSPLVEECNEATGRYMSIRGL